ncbi:MAG: chemotaxis protein CheW [Parvibaculum sp.]|uniref:hybrid sensor histidine kinase/response regulator n=1 Tax=Parvibaculum sp. TaxID=2024848 RepID=UPI002AB8E925|nr:chemotaxis protein CheW [Parvibaculum sp.]MDZ4381020.1 chemotaxis protein CheW [Parvibaculum sp.]
MDDLLKDFLAETCEALDVLDSEIVELEQRPGDPALLGSIFRVMHTIKGTCGFLGLPRLEAVAHAAEDVLGRVRDGELTISHDVISRVLVALDRIKELVASLGQTGAEPAGEDREIIDALRRIASGEADAPTSTAPAATDPVATEKKGTLFERAGAASGIDTACELACAGFAEKSAEGGALESELLKLQFALAKGFEVALQKTPGIDVADVLTCLADNGWTGDDIALLETEIGQGFRVLGIEEDDIAALCAHLHRGQPDTAPAAAPVPVPAAKAPEAPAASAPAKANAEKPETAGPGQTQALRVNINVLEDLMTLVSELVLTRNQLLQIMRSHGDSPFAAPLQRLNQVTTELQESVMMTRMQPIGNAWGKLPRLVRDLSQEVGKKIELAMTGADTELDRQVLESIRDPLTHMVRNSADHGIEMAADRLAAGKPEHGTIELSARHEGGHIVVVVSDDGRGLPTARIRDKVLANGLATEIQLESMSEQQIQQFIFRPGFSTAAAVTSVSGRGVGMDVVRNNIEKIGGIIEFQSTEGVGSRFTIKIPLTLAIVSALIVECEGERFALPQNSVVELVRINRTTSKGLEDINGHPVYRLRDRLLPLVSLCEILGLPQTDTAVEAGEADSMYVVVSQVGAFVFGIIVDKVFDTEEIVVKPVSRCMRHISCFSGTTILGDGRVIMILDPNGLATAVSAAPHAEAAALAGNARTGSRRDEAVSMLVFEAHDGGPKAVPLSLVARLEEMDLATAEKAGALTVLQYRGGLMPLIDLDGNPAERKGKRPILVFVDGQRMLGLVVDRVVDIVEAPLDMQLSGGGRPGTLGSAIIAGAATDIIDTVHYLRQGNADWFEVKTESAFGADSERNVLLVEDSAFFRNLLIPMLTVAGYSVTVAEHAEAAISLCKDGGPFDVIVSDIEMPGLSGFDLVRKLRADEKMSAVPIVALSSHANPKDIARGREAGFTDYVTKLDPTALLNVLSRTHAEESRKEDAA